MKITVCELNDNEDDFLSDWDKLVEHVHEEKSDLVLLPEMPFSPWLAYTRDVKATQWEEAVRNHEDWMERLDDLGGGMVLGTCPVVEEKTPYNEAFLWVAEEGIDKCHKKYYLPDEEGFWEASWYRRGKKEFRIEQVSGLNIGFLICTEMWFTEHARDYARRGIHILATPRATELSTAEKWIAGGRAAAVMAGAYSISSNRVGENNGIAWGGNGWIIDPNGEVMGVTNKTAPFLTLDVDLEKADNAKFTYPRYVKE